MWNTDLVFSITECELFVRKTCPRTSDFPARQTSLNHTYLSINFLSWI